VTAAVWGPPVPAAFYDQPVLEIARRLLGKTFCHLVGATLLAGRIVETEAYASDIDEASHAYRGRTPRNAVMFGPPGHLYVYRSYGIHHCLNVVTTQVNGPASAVLIRAMEPLAGLEYMRRQRTGARDSALLCGPGNVCRALGIDLRRNGYSLSEDPLRIEDAPKPTAPIVVTTRIGISRSAELPWRFYVHGSACVSRRDRQAEAAIERQQDSVAPA
jgi:DNA-3-methyladenine glycosylase